VPTERNYFFFPAGKYHFNVKEDSEIGFKIGILEVEDKDEIQNKDPTFNIQHYAEMFEIKRSNEKDGILSLKVVSIISFKTWKLVSTKVINQLVGFFRMLFFFPYYSKTQSSTKSVRPEESALPRNYIQ